MAAPADAENQTGQTASAQTGNVDYTAIAQQIDQATDKVFIKQPIRSKEFLMEMFCGCEMSNFYQVLLPDEQNNTMLPLFDLKEDSSFCMRQCCGANRSLVLNAVYPGTEDDATPPLFYIDKPYRMGCCCCSSKQCAGRNYMEVFVGGAMVGSVQEQCLCNCRVAYNVCDANDEVLCTLNRCACFCECMDVGFDILTPDGEETGQKVTKVFGGVLKEMFTTNDQFMVEFPEFMKTTQRKLLLVCAAMMVEFRHFENKKNNDGGN